MKFAFFGVTIVALALVVPLRAVPLPEPTSSILLNLDPQNPSTDPITASYSPAADLADPYAEPSSLPLADIAPAPSAESANIEIATRIVEGDLSSESGTGASGLSDSDAELSPEPSSDEMSLPDAERMSSMDPSMEPDTDPASSMEGEDTQSAEPSSEPTVDATSIPEVERMTSMDPSMEPNADPASPMEGEDTQSAEPSSEPTVDATSIPEVERMTLMDPSMEPNADPTSSTKGEDAQSAELSSEPTVDATSIPEVERISGAEPSPESNSEENLPASTSEAMPDGGADETSLPGFERMAEPSPDATSDENLPMSTTEAMVDNDFKESISMAILSKRLAELSESIEIRHKAISKQIDPSVHSGAKYSSKESTTVDNDMLPPFVAHANDLANLDEDVEGNDGK